MGRKGRKRSKPSTKKAQTAEQKDGVKGTGAWGQVFAKTNADFEEYYKENGVVPPAEYEQFLDALRRVLPTSFRVVKSGCLVDDIIAKLENAAETLPKEVEDGREFAGVAESAATPTAHAAASGTDGTEAEVAKTGTEKPEPFKVTPPQRIPWYPDGLAWQFDVPRGVLRRSPELTRFHQFLLMETEEGNISRQEAVSMIPVLFLDVQKDSTVLDLCAAPGSKTAQILEAIRSEDIKGKGMVVANDANTDRCYLLVNRTKKLECPQFLVTTHNAEAFPLNVGEYFFKFDRVLCDVPCSGDGTMRKNPDVWKKWSPFGGIGQHRIQTRIAKRGTHLLKVGGRLVYSTCSMNPMEDEAVVAEILRESKGAMRLVDAHPFAQQSRLVAHHGVSSWRVYLGHDSEVKWVDKLEDAPEQKRRKLSPSLFPPTEEEAKEFHLERCMRFLPHSMNTGGFFVAVLEKVKESEDETSHRAHVLKKIQSRKEYQEKGDGATATATESQQNSDEVQEETDSDEEARQREEAKKAKKSWTRRFGEDPIIPLSCIPQARELWEKVSAFYGIKDGFPFESLVTRTQDVGKIFLTCPAIMEIVHANDNVKAIKSVNTGLKVFKKAKGSNKYGVVDGAHYRLCNESLHYVLPYLGEKRIVRCKMSDIRTLLTKADPFFSMFSPEVEAKLKSMEMGCIVFIPTDLQRKANGKSEKYSFITVIIYLFIYLFIYLLFINLLLFKKKY